MHHKTRKNLSQSRRKRSSTKRSLLRKMTNTTKKIMPIVNSGLEGLGKNVKNVAKTTTPLLKKGLTGLYGTLSTGFNMGIKGVDAGMKQMKNITKMSSKRRRSRRKH